MFMFNQDGTDGTMFIHGVSGEAKVICMMNQYSLENWDPAQKNQPRQRS